MVVGRVGETVDPVLSDLDPVRRSQRAADEVPEALDTFSGHLRAHVVTHLKSLQRTHAAPWPAPRCGFDIRLLEIMGFEQCLFGRTQLTIHKETLTTQMGPRDPLARRSEEHTSELQ